MDGDNSRLVEMYTASLRAAEERLAILDGRKVPAEETTAARGAG